MKNINQQNTDYQLADLAPSLQTANKGKILLESLPVWLNTQTRKSAGRGRSSDNTLQYGVQKLRELILELAVSGKLIPQDPSDEPASILLKKIAEEKARLVKEGKIKKQNPLEPVTHEDIPTGLPDNWETVRLGNVINVINGRAYKKHEMLESGTPLLRVGNLFTSNEWYYSDLELGPEKYINDGDLIYAWSASFGPFIWQGGKVIYHYHIWKMDIYHPNSLDKHFIYQFLASITKQIKAAGNGIAMIHMTKDRMEKIVLSIPPLAEQHRIVKKVDELMTLCDQLEQQQADAVKAHDTLVKVLLDTLTQSENAEDFQHNWRRIAGNFDTLFTTESSIDQLKQTLLQLAVMGKLVPQDPNEEPASVLLEKIAEEKARLFKEGKIKKQKPLATISDEEKPHYAPACWVWTCLGNICQINPRNDTDDQTLVSFVPMPLVSTSHNGAHDQETRTWKEIKSGYTHFADGDVAIAKITPCFENGKAAFFQNLKNGLGAGTTELHVARPYGETLYPRYILTYLKAPQFLMVGEPRMTGTAGQKRVPKEFFAENPLPLPPLAEQHRIVQKVDELMALCDQLKERLNQAQKLQQKLADAVVDASVKKD